MALSRFIRPHIPGTDELREQLKEGVFFLIERACMGKKDGQCSKEDILAELEQMTKTSERVRETAVEALKDLLSDGFVVEEAGLLSIPEEEVKEEEEELSEVEQAILDLLREKGELRLFGELDEAIVRAHSYVGTKEVVSAVRRLVAKGLITHQAKGKMRLTGENEAKEQTRGEANENPRRFEGVEELEI